MLPNLDKLAQKVNSLGLGDKVVQKGKRPAKEDYVTVLREHFLPKGGLPFTEVSPMLCFAEWNLKDAERENIWKSQNWIAQKKLNGCRAVVHFVKGKGVFAHSRTVSLKTYRFQEMTDQILFADHIPTFSATIDCEVMVEKPIDTRAYTAHGEVTKSSLHSTTALLHLEPSASKRLQKDQDAPLMFHAFDIMMWEGEDLTKKTLKNRLDVLETFKTAIAATNIKDYFIWPTWTRDDKKAFFADIIAKGGEGVILKNLTSIYEDSTSRGRDKWVKVKKRMEYDCFVTGFIRGEKGTGWENMVGALEFSVFGMDGSLHQIAAASNLTMENRERMTVYDKATDTVTLHQGMIGKVAEVSGQDISARSYRLSHATIERFRSKDGPDAKRPEDCKVDLVELKAKADWVA